MNTAESQDDLESAVLAYLAEHPQAMDTLEGVTKWWIERERIRASVAAVSHALSRLVDQGVLQRVGSGDNALYRCAHTRGSVFD